MKWPAWAILAVPAWAHVVSMSSGDLKIEGAHARYELRMPLYEIGHVPHPESALLDHVRFAGARLVSRNCAEDKSRDLYVCDAEYDFDTPPERVDVECTLAAITVPNHVHMLRAELGSKHDQGLFDAAFPRATLRFRPPTAAEVAMTEGGAGFVEALGGPVQILFLAALALAARSRRELASLVAMFLAGQVLAVLVMPRIDWQPAPRFVEAAAALTVAYLAIEILLLPRAGSRWAVAGILGVFHGLYFHLFLQTAGYRPGFVLAGAAGAEMAVVAVLALLFSRVERWARALRPLQVSATALLLFGMVWFVLRLRG
jgi:HupE / UreJ protein